MLVHLLSLPAVTNNTQIFYKNKQQFRNVIFLLRNYGGVYVGLPADLTTVATSQAKPTHKGKHDTTLCLYGAVN